MNLPLPSDILKAAGAAVAGGVGAVENVAGTAIGGVTGAVGSITFGPDRVPHSITPDVSVGQFTSMGRQQSEPLPWQQRVVAEHRDLCERTSKLLAFIGSPAFGNVDPYTQRLMQRQLALHWELEHVLYSRISAFEVL